MTPGDSEGSGNRDASKVDTVSYLMIDDVPERERSPEERVADAELKRTLSDFVGSGVVSATCNESTHFLNVVGIMDTTEDEAEPSVALLDSYSKVHRRFAVNKRGQVVSDNPDGWQLVDPEEAREVAALLDDNRG